VRDHGSNKPFRSQRYLYHSKMHPICSPSTRTIVRIPYSCYVQHFKADDMLALKLATDPMICVDIGRVSRWRTFLSQLTVFIHQDSRSYLEMLRVGKEVVSEHKSILDHLGKSQNFLKSLLGLGSAASEVRLLGEIHQLTNVDLKLHPVAQSILVSINSLYQVTGLSY
jgi:hypothetical protein